MNRKEKKHDTTHPPFNASSTSSGITLTYGDGSTTELNNRSTKDVSNQNWTNNNDYGSSLIFDEIPTTQDVIFPKSQPTFSITRKTNTSILPGRARRRGAESTNNSKLKGTPTTAAPLKRRRKRRSRKSHNSKTINIIRSFFSLFFQLNEKHEYRDEEDDDDHENHKSRRKKKHHSHVTKGIENGHVPRKLMKQKRRSKSLSIPVAVTCWYLLGVLSISTTKILLTPHVPLSLKTNNILDPVDATNRTINAKNKESKLHWSQLHSVGGITPLLLSLQQFTIGAMILRFILKRRLLFSIAGIGDGIAPLGKRKSLHKRGNAQRELFLAGLFFSMGFVATNFSFKNSSPSFVETIKAAEPITSASIAFFNGIETLSHPEILSLIVIVFGVLTSTLANSSDQSRLNVTHASSLSLSAWTCGVVLLSNLFFSLRGLHQKLLRATNHGSKEEIDDVNLQYRMQQIGALTFFIPAVVIELPQASHKLWSLSRDYGILENGILFRYIILSLINGFAFVSYNLASTIVLTRISVVHHATLNCLRRIFAIVVTSIMFGIPITMLSAVGILLSIAGFLSFTRYKTQQKTHSEPLSCLLPMSTV